MDESRHWTISSLSTHLSIPNSTVYKYLTEELKMTKKLGKWIPHELNRFQIEHRILACKQNLSLLNKEKKLLLKTISIDESWVSLNMASDRDQMRSWYFPGETSQSYVKQNIHGHKRMLIMAMDFNGICSYKLLSEKITVNSEICKNFLEEEILKWLTKKSFKTCILLHDNARPHKSKVVVEFLKQNKIREWYQPPYSPDVSPLDFNCFGQSTKDKKIL